jgi:hypothetical protein
MYTVVNLCIDTAFFGLYLEHFIRLSYMQKTIMYVFVIKVSGPPMTAAQSINSNCSTTDFQLKCDVFYVLNT